MSYQTLKEIGQDSGQTLVRFPLVMLSALVGTINAIIVVEKGAYFFESPLTLVSFLGIPLFISIKLLQEILPIGKIFGLLLNGIGLALLISYGFYLPANLGEAPSYYGTQYLMTSLGLHFIVAASPLLRKQKTKAFWFFNQRIFISILYAGINSGILLASLALLFLSIKKLFGIEVDDNVYLYACLIVVGLFNTLLFLRGVPKGPLDPKKESQFPKGLRVFVRYTLRPLSLIYILSLYAYVGKTLIQRTWPAESVVAPILFMSALGILGALLCYPLLREKNEEQWIALYYRWFFFLLIPLSIILGLTIKRHIQAYGMTEERCIIMVLAAWLTYAGIYFTFSREKNIRWIPMTLGIICLLTVWSPINAFTLSLASQKERLATLLTTQELFENDRILNWPQYLERSELDPELNNETRSCLHYLLEKHGLASIDTWLEDFYRDSNHRKAFAQEQTSRQVADLMTFMGLSLKNKNISFVSLKAGTKRAFSATSFNELYLLNLPDYVGRQLGATLRIQDSPITIKVKGSTVTVRLNRTPIGTMDLSSLFKAQTQSHDVILSPDALRMDFKHQDLTGTLIFESVQAYKDPRNRWWIKNGKLLLLLK